MDLEDIENKIARLGAENASLKEKLGEAAHVDIALAEDALAKFAATVALLKHIEECEKCSLRYDLLVLLEVENYLGKGALHRFKKKRDAVHRQLEEMREKTGLKEAVAEALEAIDAQEEEDEDGKD